MKALTFSRYGGPEVLRISDIPRPVPGENQVLIKVKALSLNDWDRGLIRGRPFINRTMAGSLLRPKGCIPGSDIAGVVEEVGYKVTRFQRGDRVFGDLSGSESWGGCAEYVCAGEDELALMGDELTFEDAAALPQAGMLALQALIDQGNMKSGQSMLVNGAGGGVGVYCLQIARTLGLSYAAGVDRSDKFAMMRDLGYDKVLDFTKGELLKEDRQYDLIVDTQMSHPLRKYRPLLKKGGTYVAVGGKTGLLVRLMLFGTFKSLFMGRNFKSVLLKANRDLTYLKDLNRRGLMKNVIDGPWPFEEIIEAFEHYDKGGQKGKIVITFS